jgi:two-component system, OmpR family, response regulator
VPDEPTETGSIIVADGDEAVRRMVTAHFEEKNVRVSIVSNRDELIFRLKKEHPSLIILNRKLGKWDGLDLLRDIRSTSNVPVVIVAEHSPDEIDRIVGLELGADDYIEKPFSARELLARARAIWRRQGRGVERSQDQDQGGYRFRGWRLEQRTRTVVDSSGASIALRRSEYELLVAFLKAPQQFLTRAHLLRTTRLRENASDRSIDVQVMRLRRKLESDPKMRGAIKAVSGIGYAFTPEVDPY